FNKPAAVAVPFWLYYFNVHDLDAALERVRAGGGQVFEGPIGLPGDIWIARCVDPLGAVFALRGARSQDAIERDPAAEFGWSSAWGGIS
ncbi:UNVERIFIED_CONTAM: VOC family protein, partial [Bacteroidetes bacterium 56_B9]